MDEIEIDRSAKLLIDQYAANTSVQAARNADAILERGDLDGFNIWIWIGRAIEDIQSNAGRTVF